MLVKLLEAPLAGAAGCPIELLLLLSTEASPTVKASTTCDGEKVIEKDLGGTWDKVLSWPPACSVSWNKSPWPSVSSSLIQEN